MPGEPIDNLLKQLENRPADELAELEELGAAYFETGHLLRLRGQWEVKNALFHTFQQFFIRLMAVSPLWLVLWFFLARLGWTFASLFFLALFPLSFALFLGGLWFMQHFFKGSGHLDRVGKMISEELTKRQRARK
jgi:hypothetical protein